MNTLSRIVVCLIVMALPVTVQALLLVSPVSYPTSMSGPEGADVLYETWDFVNNNNYAVDIFPNVLLSYGGDDLSDAPTIDPITCSPDHVSGDKWSTVPKNTHYSVTFRVVPQSLDPDPGVETPADYGWTKVELQLMGRIHGGLGWDGNWYSQGTYMYTYWDPGYIPEPASLVLFGIGAIGLRARRKQAA